MIVRVEDALPPAGTVTGPGRFIVTPLGAVPIQAVVRPMEELNPFTDESTIVVDAETPGAKVIMAGDGWVMKSGTATGARTDGVAAIVTLISVECETAPPIAVTRSV